MTRRQAADKARRLALADNRSSEAGLSWHLEILQGDAALGLLDGLWTPNEMDELFASVETPDEDPNSHRRWRRPLHQRCGPRGQRHHPQHR